MDYVDRGEWGARPPKQPYTGIASSSGLAIHHVGAHAKPPESVEAAKSRLRGIQNYHMDTKGWNDIAYGWAVSAGRIFRLRGWGVIDGADTGAGRLMHSVCWLGDGNDYTPTEADKAAINAVVAEHARLYPGAASTVLGHRDINSTDCPGNQLYAWLQNGRPGAVPPPPSQEEDEMKTIVGWDPRQGQWYHVCGNQAVRITGEVAGGLKYIGVTDVGQLSPNFLEGMKITTGGLAHES